MIRKGSKYFKVSNNNDSICCYPLLIARDFFMLINYK